MTGFFEEIKRRKVYRVVVAGGAIQLASAVFPAWGLPSWALRLVIILLLIGFPISLILAWAVEVTPEGIRAQIDKSIAVLPFENLSDDKENAYFADGIQDDILTNLSKIGDLKVISRTSMMPYRGQTHTIREIGRR